MKRLSKKTRNALIGLAATVASALLAQHCEVDLGPELLREGITMAADYAEADGGAL